MGSGDGGAATDSFKDGIIHAVWVEVIAFSKAGGMVMFNEKTDAKCVMKAAYNNPLDMWRTRPWSSRTSHGLPAAFYLPPPRRPSLSACFRLQGSVNERRGSLDP